MARTVSCPHCGKPVVWGSTSPWRPFCSERCRLIDLGDWLDENHRIPDAAEGTGEEPPETDAPHRAH